MSSVAQDVDFFSSEVYQVKNVLFLVVLLCMTVNGFAQNCVNDQCFKNVVSTAANVATLPVRALAELNDSCSHRDSVLSVVPFVVSGQPSVGYVVPSGGDPVGFGGLKSAGDLCQDGKIVQTYQRGYRVLSRRELQMIHKLRKSCR